MVKRADKGSEREVKAGDREVKAGDKPKTKTLKQTDDAVSFMSSIKGSTSKVMKLLTRRQYDVPDSIPNSDPDFIRLTRLEALSMSAEIGVQMYPTRIQKTINAYEDQIATLDTLGSRSARAEAQNYTSSFAALKADGLERIKNREALANEIKTFIQQKDGIFKEIVKAMVEKRPAADVEALIAQTEKQIEDLHKRTIELYRDTQGLFDQVEKQISDLQKSTIQLNRNEKITQSSLDTAYQNVTQVLNAERTKLGIAVTPDMQKRPE